MVAEKQSFMRKVPGFRSGKPWKMIVASLFYIIVAIAIVSLAIPNESSNVETETKIDCTGKISKAIGITEDGDMVQFRVENSCERDIAVTEFKWDCTGYNLNTGEKIRQYDLTLSDFELVVPAGEIRDKYYIIYSENIYDVWTDCKGWVTWS